MSKITSALTGLVLLLTMTAGTLLAKDGCCNGGACCKAGACCHQRAAR